MPEYKLHIPNSVSSQWNELDSFTKGYIECAMWLLTDEDGESCDDLDFSDLSECAIKQMREDCAAFQNEKADALEVYQCHRNAWHKAGTDFFLTRNGHGAGFWEDERAVGKELTDAAKAWGSADLYLGDDGKIYHY